MNKNTNFYLYIFQVSNDEVFSRIPLSDLMQLMIAHTQETANQDVKAPQYTVDVEAVPSGGDNLLIDDSSIANSEEIDTVSQMEALQVV